MNEKLDDIQENCIKNKMKLSLNLIIIYITTHFRPKFPLFLLTLRRTFYLRFLTHQIVNKIKQNFLKTVILSFNLVH